MYHNWTGFLLRFTQISGKICRTDTLWDIFGKGVLRHNCVETLHWGNSNWLYSKFSLQWVYITWLSPLNANSKLKCENQPFIHIYFKWNNGYLGCTEKLICIDLCFLFFCFRCRANWFWASWKIISRSAGITDSLLRMWKFNRKKRRFSRHQCTSARRWAFQSRGEFWK